MDKKKRHVEAAEEKRREAAAAMEKTRAAEATEKQRREAEASEKRGARWRHPRRSGARWRQARRRRTRRRLPRRSGARRRRRQPSSATDMRSGHGEPSAPSCALCGMAARWGRPDDAMLATSSSATDEPYFLSYAASHVAASGELHLAGPRARLRLRGGWGRADNARRVIGCHFTGAMPVQMRFCDVAGMRVTLVVGGHLRHGGRQARRAGRACYKVIM